MNLFDKTGVINLCCICLKKSEKFSKTLYNNGLYYKLTISIPEMRFELLNINQFICDACAESVNDVYNFRNKCLLNKPVFIDSVIKHKERQFQLETERRCAQISARQKVSTEKHPTLIQQLNIAPTGLDPNIDHYLPTNTSQHPTYNNDDPIVIKEETESGSEGEILPDVPFKKLKHSDALTDLSNAQHRPEIETTTLSPLNVAPLTTSVIKKRRRTPSASSVMHTHLEQPPDIQIRSPMEPDGSGRSRKHSSETISSPTRTQSSPLRITKAHRKSESSLGRSRHTDVATIQIPSTSQSDPELIGGIRTDSEFITGIRTEPELITAIRNKPNVVAEIRNESNIITGIRNEPNAIAVRNEPNVITGIRNERNIIAGIRNEPNVMMRNESNMIPGIRSEPELMGRIRSEPELITGIQSESELIQSDQQTEMGPSLGDIEMVKMEPETETEYREEELKSEIKIEPETFQKYDFIEHSESTETAKSEAFQDEEWLPYESVGNQHIDPPPRQLGKKRYPCLECDRSFDEEFQLQLHQVVHITRLQYSCDQCNKTFNHISALNKHKQSQSHNQPKPYKCPKCNQSFAQRNHLMTHSVVHTNVKTYECVECNRTFGTNEYLKKHMLTHTGQRPYKCSMCEKTFTQSSNLSRHERLHEKKGSSLYIEPEIRYDKYN